MKKSVIFLVFGILLMSSVIAEERFHVVLSNEQNFVFMENDGTGKFTARTTIDASPFAHEITAGDFDLDGIWDAAVNHHQEGAFTVFWGNKDKTFTKQKFDIPVVQGGEMHAIGSGDFDEDGDIDLALVDNGQVNSVVIALSDGKRGFSEYRRNDMPRSNTRVITVNDFNGDKHLDFIVPESATDLGRAFIFFGDGQGNFDMKEISGATRLHAIKSGDIDNDGDIDLAFAASLVIAVLKNNGKGEFAASDSFCIKDSKGVCTQPDFFAVELSDLDNDGFMDVIGLRADGLYILRGDGTGKFKASARKPASVEFTEILRNKIDIESVDIDSDNIKDIIVGALERVQNTGQTGILVFKNKIDATGCPDPNNPALKLGPGPICVDSVTKYSAGKTNQPDQVTIDIYHETIEEVKIPLFTRGDVNQDKAVDLSDAVYLLQHLFLGGEKPKCLDSADFDDSGIIDLSDPIYLLQNLFLAGPVLPEPFKDARGNLIVGEDKTDDQLDCEFYPE